MQLLVYLPYRCYIPNLVKISSVVIEKKMLMDDAHQHIAIVHLSDTGDLKMSLKIHLKVKDDIRKEITKFIHKLTSATTLQLKEFAVVKIYKCA